MYFNGQENAGFHNTGSSRGWNHRIDNFNFYGVITGKYAIVVFYPMDFTFVCPSELIALSNRIGKLKELGVEVVAILIDSHHTHNAWGNTEINNGGIGKVEHTLAADMDHGICQAYGCTVIARNSPTL